MRPDDASCGFNFVNFNFVNFNFVNFNFVNFKFMNFNFVNINFVNLIKIGKEFLTFSSFALWHFSKETS